MRISTPPAAARFAAVVAIALAVLPSCGSPWQRFTADGDRDRRDLIALVEAPNQDLERRFAAARQVAADYYRSGDLPSMIDFLSTFVERNPDDPYRSFHLFTVACAYEESGSPAIAAAYFDRILRTCPDLVAEGSSIHHRALEHLVALTSDPVPRIGYLSDLIERFPGETDLPAMIFRLGKEYEKVGEWRLALKCYARFMPYAGAEVAEYPDAFAYARRMVDFDSGPKNWAFNSLDALIDKIKTAIGKADFDAIERYRSQIGFFVLTWRQSETAVPTRAEFAIANFIPAKDAPKVSFANAIDPSSNSNEAYLRSVGWAGPNGVWYLYFRKINFPADIDVHGRWEWVGIYMGEKP